MKKLEKERAAIQPERQVKEPTFERHELPPVVKERTSKRIVEEV